MTSRPNCTVLLGGRHGWRPLPDKIPAAEFEALRPHLPAELASRWYRLDENAVWPPPGGSALDKGRYVLQPRTGEFAGSDLLSRGNEVGQAACFGVAGSAGFRACRIAGFPTGEVAESARGWARSKPCRLKVGDTAGSKACATARAGKREVGPGQFLDLPRNKLTAQEF